MSAVKDTAVMVQGLSFQYPKATAPIFDDCDASFGAGEVTAITGSSGSGKSTLLYVLALLLTPSAGSVRWGNDVVSGWDDARRSAHRATRAGFVFQDAMLDPAKSVLSNIVEQAIFAGWDRENARRRARELSERLGVEHRLDGKPGEISGGQAQRVALCRALLTDPKVIFADEPTGNLDSVAADAVIATLEERARAGACVIVATHDEVVSSRANHVVTL